MNNQTRMHRLFKAKDSRLARLEKVARDLRRIPVDSCVEFSDDGTPIHAGAEVVKDVRLAIAEAKEDFAMNGESSKHGDTWRPLATKRGSNPQPQHCEGWGFG